MLRGTELKLYQSNKDVPKKQPRLVINLDKCCKSSTKNGKEIQLDMSDKVYHLVAADKTEREAWLRGVCVCVCVCRRAYVLSIIIPFKHELCVRINLNNSCYLH